ncbi:MAG TPA: GIY-YIG nuclease family protein [Armatimonadota bacterium]|nr:GIY-YIG nuclease family protein [Armatimonadota bacterium]
MDREGGWFDSVPYFMYILRSARTGRYYIGSAEDPAFRLGEHNQGKVGSTKAHRPWEIVYLEEYATRSEAYARERYVKRQKSRAWMEGELLGKDAGL